MQVMMRLLTNEKRITSNLIIRRGEQSMYTAEQMNEFIKEFLGDILNHNTSKSALYYDVEMYDEYARIIFESKYTIHSKVYNQTIGTSDRYTYDIYFDDIDYWFQAKALIKTVLANPNEYKLYTCKKTLVGQSSIRKRFNNAMITSMNYFNKQGVDKNVYIGIILNKLLPSSVDNIFYVQEPAAALCTICGDVREEGYAVGPIIFSKKNKLSFAVRELAGIYKRLEVALDNAREQAQIKADIEHGARIERLNRYQMF